MQTGAEELTNSILFINIQIIQANVKRISEELPAGAALLPVLKCDAYGLGLLPVAKAVLGTGCVHTLAVAQVYEAVRLREAGVGRETDILVIGAAASDAQIVAAAENGILLTVPQPGFVARAAALLRRHRLRLRVHIKINSGLNRLGSAPGPELDAVIAELKDAADVVGVAGVFSHFSDLDGGGELLWTEYGRYTRALERLADAGIAPGMRHMCASASFEKHPELALDGVRIGRRLYYNQLADPTGPIRDAASWRALITDVRARHAGDALGYGGAYVLDADAVIATMGVGYGDCALLSRLAAVHAPVLIGGKRCRLVGCCMDQCFAEATGADCAVGDTATLIGFDGCGNLLPGQEIAALIDDEACSITAALSTRVRRVYE